MDGTWEEKGITGFVIALIPFRVAGDVLLFLAVVVVLLLLLLLRTTVEHLFEELKLRGCEG